MSKLDATSVAHTSPKAHTFGLFAPKCAQYSAFITHESSAMIDKRILRAKRMMGTALLRYRNIKCLGSALVQVRAVTNGVQMGIWCEGVHGGGIRATLRGRLQRGRECVRSAARRRLALRATGKTGELTSVTAARLHDGTSHSFRCRV